MVDSLKTFNEGEYIYASETNSNNQYLLSKLSDNAAQVQTYVEGEISSIQSNVASVQATLQANIDELKNGVGSAKAYIVETYVSGASWYIVWSNGWKEQGGVFTAGGSATGKKLTFLKEFSNTNYNVVCNPISNTSEQNCILSKTTTSCNINSHGHGGSAFYTDHNVNWRACGY